MAGEVVATGEASRGPFERPTAEQVGFAERVTRLRRLLTAVYGEDGAGEALRSILQTVGESRGAAAAAGGPRGPGPRRWSQDDVVLITYGHSIVDAGRRPLEVLDEFLSTRLAGRISTVHVLPFFPWSSDDGFAVVDYFSVDPYLGDWSALGALGRHFVLMADLVINHVSRESLWFMDYVNDREPGRSFFIAVDPETDLSAVVRPRTSPLLVPVHTYRGLRHVWATFSEDQIDLDFSRPRVLAEMVRVLCFYLRQGIRVVRLDAVAYLWKEIGTACIHHENTHRLIKALRLVSELVCDPDEDPVVLITETNVPHAENVSYFGGGDEAHLVYQFPLAPLTLHALLTGTASYINQWLQELGEPPPGCTFLNFTASHDGIGLRPVEGLLPESDVAGMIDLVHELGGFVSMRAVPEVGHRPYEINISLFDALAATLAGRDDRQQERFLASQTLMLSLQGLPALYIHSLFATPNDREGMERTGRVRSINRRVWQRRELEALLSDPSTPHARVFEALTRLLALRRTLPAFAPDAGQTVHEVDASLVVLRRGSGPESVLVVINVGAESRWLSAPTLAALGVAPMAVDLIGDAAVDAAEGLDVPPYGCFWLQSVRT